MPRMYPFYTTIKADYLISSHTNINNFIFIINTNSQNESKCDFLCLFKLLKKENVNYETNQTCQNITQKERIHIPSNTSVIFLIKLLMYTYLFVMHSPIFLFFIIFSTLILIFSNSSLLEIRNAEISRICFFINFFQIKS